MYIKDLSGYVVNNADDMDRIMTLGHKNRKQNNWQYEVGNSYPQNHIFIFIFHLDVNLWDMW